MKPRFIVRYAGAAVKFNGTDIELVDDAHATEFPRFSAALETVYRTHLNYQWLDIVDLNLEAATAARNN